MRKAIVILHNVRSATNVGAIFRTCDGVGVDKVYLSGYTPTPINRFGGPQKDIVKSALGAEKFVEWEQMKNITLLLRKLKDEGYSIVCVEQTESSVDYRTIVYRGKMAFIFGNEIRGISTQVLHHADLIAEIHMVGKKESLNVATAAGVFLFRILRP